MKLTVKLYFINCGTSKGHQLDQFYVLRNRNDGDGVEERDASVVKRV